MTVRFFVDTNVIVYTRDQNAPEKREQAIEWLAEISARQAIVISPQVLNEAMRVFVEKFELDPGDLQRFCRGIASWCTGPNDPEVTEAALSARSKWKFAWWDCTIVASALAANCDYLLTEDLQNGQMLESLTVVNPFSVPPSLFFSGA
jgi:predicted nucleic acid-binding protein